MDNDELSKLIRNGLSSHFVGHKCEKSIIDAMLLIPGVSSVSVKNISEEEKVLREVMEEPDTCVTVSYILKFNEPINFIKTDFTTTDNK